MRTPNITIIDRQRVSDPDYPGCKEVVTYSVATSADIDTILDFYPNTQSGSFVLCLPEGVLRTLLDGNWI